MERAVGFEIQRQANLANKGQPVLQETLGWDEAKGVTFSQRSKEDAHDYRYFPEPDLPPLVIEKEWIERVRGSLPELPYARFLRFQKQYELNAYDANLLVSDQEVADYFEAAASDTTGVPPKTLANWILGDLFSLLNQRSESLASLKILLRAWQNWSSWSTRNGSTLPQPKMCWLKWQPAVNLPAASLPKVVYSKSPTVVRSPGW